MKNINNDLQNLFISRLKPRLSKIDSMRKDVRLAYIKLGVSIFLLFIIFIIPLSVILKFLILAIAIIFTIILFIKAIYKKLSFRTFYKKNIVREIVTLINPNWIYEPNRFILNEFYNASMLSTKHYDRYSGDDLVYGKIDKTDFECSEIHTEYKKTSRNVHGKTKTSWHTVFKGLFFHADFNKHFQGQTIVKPDRTEKLLGAFGSKLQGWFGTKNIVRLENSAFEKLFIVKSTDKIEARYILTPAVMEAMIKLHKRYGKKNISFSFTGSRVYCVLHSKNNLFEPSITSKNDFNDILFMYEMFQINKLIIEELNLNTRIWTKE